MLAAESACPGCGRSACRSAAKTASVPVSPSTLIAAARSAVGDQGAQVGDREHEHAEHAVGAVDEGESLLLAQLDRGDAGGGERVGGRHEGAGCVAHLALAHQRERAVRERRQVAGAAEAAVFADDRGDAGVEHGGVGLRRRSGGRRCGRWRGWTGAAASWPAPLRAPPPGRCWRRGCAPASAAAGRAARRDLLGGQRAESGRDAVVRLGVGGERLDHGAARGHGPQRIRLEFDDRAAPGDRDQLVEADGANTERHRRLVGECIHVSH